MARTDHERLVSRIRTALAVVDEALPLLPPRETESLRGERLALRLEAFRLTLAECAEKDIG